MRVAEAREAFPRLQILGGLDKIALAQGMAAIDAALERVPFLARLCVFRGGFQPEAAGQVAGATLPILSALADKSLLRETSGHFEMHELVMGHRSTDG